MARLFMFAAVVIAFALPACSVTDGDDMDGLSNSLRAMPPPQLRVVRDHRSNARIREWAEISPNSTVGMFACREQLMGDQDYQDGKVFRVRRRDVLELAELLPDWTLTMLLEGLDRGFRPQAEEMLFNVGDFHTPCELEFSLNEGVLEDAQAWERGERDEYIDDAEDSAYWLPTLDSDGLKERPLLLGALGLAVAGGVIVISVTNPVLLALCPKSDAFECPGNPMNPGGSSPVNPNGAPGGDR